MNFLKEKSSTKTLILSLVIVGICVVLFSIVFLYIGKMGDGVVNADELKDVKTLSAQDVNKQASDLKIRVNYNDQKVPRNAVSPQYAAALATDITKRVFAKNPTGRVIVELSTDGERIGSGKGVSWLASVEVKDGYVDCDIDALTGTDSSANYNADKDALEGFLYTWKSAKDNDKEIPYTNSNAAEQKSANNYYNALNDEDKSLEREKKGLTEQYMERKKDLPHGEKALAFVKKTKLANEAAPTSGQIVMGNADEGEETEYWVEVKLDNQKSIILTMKAKSMEVIGYDRYETNFLDTIYPVK